MGKVTSGAENIKPRTCEGWALRVLYTMFCAPVFKNGKQASFSLSKEIIMAATNLE